MRKTQLAASIGSAALILSGAAMAQVPPLPQPALPTVPSVGGFYGGSACGAGGIAGATCSTVAAEADGSFLQEQVLLSTGETFFHTVIPDVNAAGFASEDWVQMQTGQGGAVTGATQGIASQVFVGDGATGFATQSNIYAGWANDLNPGVENTSHAIITMAIEGVNPQPNNAFSNTFVIDTSFDGTTNTLLGMSIDQTVELGVANQAGTPDKQVFNTSIVAASAAGSFAFTPGIPAAIQPAGSQADWNQGETIQMLWVGQDMQGSGVGTFGTQLAQNITNQGGANSFTQATSLTNTGPWGWDAEFGPEPTF